MEKNTNTIDLKKLAINGLILSCLFFAVNLLNVKPVCSIPVTTCTENTTILLEDNYSANDINEIISTQFQYNGQIPEIDIADLQNEQIIYLENGHPCVDTSKLATYLNIRIDISNPTYGTILRWNNLNLYAMDETIPYQEAEIGDNIFVRYSDENGYVNSNQLIQNLKDLFQKEPILLKIENFLIKNNIKKYKVIIVPYLDPTKTKVEDQFGGVNSPMVFVDEVSQAKQVVIGINANATSSPLALTNEFVEVTQTVLEDKQLLFPINDFFEGQLITFYLGDLLIKAPEFGKHIQGEIGGVKIDINFPSALEKDLTHGKKYEEMSTAEINTLRREYINAIGVDKFMEAFNNILLAESNNYDNPNRIETSYTWMLKIPREHLSEALISSNWLLEVYGIDNYFEFYYTEDTGTLQIKKKI